MKARTCLLFCKGLPTKCRPSCLFIPNKALLQAKVKEWIEEFEENEELKKLEEHE